MLSINLPTLSEASYESIKEQILCGTIRPGKKINLDQCASMLGVSATPIREALTKLQQEGLTQYIPRVGWRVVKLSRGELMKYYEIQTLLEMTLAERAFPYIEEKHVNLIKMHNDQMLSLLQENKTGPVGKELLEANDQFHKALYISYPNNIMFETLLQIWNRVQYQRRVMFDSKQRPQGFYEEHLTIIRALTEKNKEAFLDAIQTHFNGGLRAIEEILVETAQNS